MGTSESEPEYCFVLKPKPVAQPLPGRLHFCGNVLEIGDADFFIARIKRDAARKPADGDQAEQFGCAGLELENGDGVLRAVADEKFFAGLVECQRIRLRAERIARILPRANRLDDRVRARVNDAQRIAAGIRHDEEFFVWRQCHGAGVQAGENFAVTPSLSHPMGEGGRTSGEGIRRLNFSQIND